MQVYASLLAGVRGFMFYRLGIQSSPMNTTFQNDVLLPVLYEIMPHLPSFLHGERLVAGTNVSEKEVSTGLYRHVDAAPPSSTVKTIQDETNNNASAAVLVALRWNAATGTGV